MLILNDNHLKTPNIRHWFLKNDVLKHGMSTANQFENIGLHKN